MQVSFTIRSISGETSPDRLRAEAEAVHELMYPNWRLRQGDPNPPPTPREPICEVLVQLDGPNGSRIELHITNWDQAAALTVGAEASLSL